MADVHTARKVPLADAADVSPPAAGIWDAEWMRAWKAHPENVWFDYEAGVYLAELRARAAREPRRVLKTDAFDEACGRRRLAADLGADSVVVVDVSPRVARHAARLGVRGLVASAADVRRLPFAPGSFDLVLSTSTLDHFDRRAEIAVALAELRTVVRPGGRLFVTLDNPGNPILRLRRRVYARTGPVGGVLPFRMGLTLSREALVETAERAGFEVRASGHVVHAPRLFALWAGEWAARRHSTAGARAIGAVLWAIERVARRLPTRRWTGHFIFAECRVPGPS
jgi:SAM-dependent methyltransferase